MITRPLDLAVRVRRPPQSFGAFYFINGALIVFFFFLFGSRFVLAPGLGVGLTGGFVLPTMEGSKAGATTTDVVISVPRPGVALVDEGMMSFDRLGDWLHARAQEHKAPVLLIRADQGVPMQDIAHLAAMAKAAGFVYVQLAFDEPPEAK
ncbi:MAG TPA: biopolymer transporter ExbD [Opitutaceae bacterium]|jgi:biopolymer transport protein ExbD|nr:biopolymer transporter ExbD [Opitutaceae bacterium]